LQAALCAEMLTAPLQAVLFGMADAQKCNTAS